MLELLAPGLEAAVLAQVQPGPASQPGVVGSVAGSAVGSFLTTLILGGLLVTFAEDYPVRMMASLREEPLGSFVYGVVALLALLVVAVFLAITIVGLLLVIYLLIVAYVVWAVGASLAFLAIGDWIVGRDGWLKPLLVGAAINGGLTVTGVGAFVTFVVGAAGFGAVFRDRL